MFSKIKTAGLSGIDGYLVDIEADVQNGLPGFTLTGLLSTDTKEAQSRVWNAVRSSVLRPEPKKITVNFSPAYVRKEGTGYDLPIAVAVLCAYGAAAYRGLEDTAFFGELGLDGSVKAIRGALPLACVLKDNGIVRLVVPYENVDEAALIGGLEVIGCGSINETIDIIKRLSKTKFDPGRIKLQNYDAELDEQHYNVDFSEVKGQKYLRRAAEIAASGMHNFLMSGPAGTGKTLIAKCLPTILPSISREENIEISKAYSICGLLPEGKPLLSRRPFRNPHYGITAAAFAGGGMRAMPGEISLASGGILFLDELPLFSKNVLEMLRLPLEEHFICVTRMKGSCIYPADFLLAAALNPCPCGYYPDRNRCKCSPAQIHAYMGRLSKPLLERIDICAEADPLKAEDIIGNEDKAECSEDIRKRVERVHKLQRERFAEDGIKYNSRMGLKEIEKYCVLDDETSDFIKKIFVKKQLSGRTYHKILKVARTIADMEGMDDISKKHLAEAISLRGIEDKLFG